MKFSFAILIALLFGASGAAADDGLREQGARQQQIREATAGAGDQLARLIGEFERNGITGEEVDTLSGIRAVLSDLSDRQMADIVQLLQDAGGAASNPKTLSAYTGQKAVIVQLRQVLLEYRRQLALDELARLVRALGDRQSANLHQALAILNATRLQGNPNTTQKISVQLQASEQASIRDETAHLLDRLRPLAFGDDDRPARGAALANRRDLNTILTTATDDLEGGRLMSAASSEKTARDTLWQLAEILRSQQALTEQLSAAAAELDELIGAEKQVIAMTRQLDQEPPIPGEEKTTEEPLIKKGRGLVEAVEAAEQRAARDARRQLWLQSPEEASQQAAADARQNQGETVDRSEFLRGQLESVSPTAASQLGESVADMQQARAHLGSNLSPGEKKSAALPREQAALGKLEDARATVLAQLELARQASVEEDDAGEPQPDKVEQLATLLETVQGLEEEQEKLQAQIGPQQAAQAALENRTSQAARQSATAAPEAAGHLADAAGQMAAAAAQMGQGQPADDEQQGANDALANAADSIRGELEELQAAKQELASIDSILEKLEPIIREQRDLQTSTSRPDPDSARLAEQQSDLQDRTAALGDEADNPQISAASASQDQASQALAKGRPREARAPQAQALAQLGAARDALDQRREELAATLGQAPPPGADLAALEKAIASAQGLVSQGLNQLEGGAVTAAATPLAQASDTISPFTAGTQGELPAAVDLALQEAQASLARSTAAAAAADQSPARSGALSAQGALAQAAAALTLAQAGLGAPAPSSQQASAKPGEEPGEGEGSAQASEGGKPGDQSGQSDSGRGNWADGGGAGERESRSGASQFIGLPPRERGTLRQGAAGAYPAEYSSMIEQYLKNLSDQASGK